MTTDKTFIIAEAGVNHNGSVDLARRLIDVAADAGADAVKFQTFRAEKLASRFAPKAEYQIATTGDDVSQFEMLKQLELSQEAHWQLVRHCVDRNIEFMSTAFDIESLQFLVKDLGIKRIKIPSGEITNGPLLLAAAQFGLPILLSTGMSDLDDIHRALGVLAFGFLELTEAPSGERFILASESADGRELLKRNLCILHCVTEYPAPMVSLNLRAMETISRKFMVQVGYSDHSLGISASLAAVALGAKVIEKHFTLDKLASGPDHRASLDPGELKSLVSGIREIEDALGESEKRPAQAELKNVVIARKSLVAAKMIRKGDPFSAENLTVKRPGGGRSPMEYWTVIGTVAERDYREDEVI